MSRRLVRGTVVVICWLPFVVAAAAEEKPKESSEQPEDVFRRFILSVLKGDDKAVCGDALPCPGMSVLWGGKPSSREEIAEAEKSIANMKLRRLQPGDSFTLPGGKTLRFTRENLGTDRVCLTGDEMPTPTFLERVDGRWQVDAQPFIKARQTSKVQSVVGVPRDEQKHWQRKAPSNSPVTPATLLGARIDHASRVAAPEELPSEQPGSNTWVMRTEKRADASRGIMVITHMQDPRNDTLEKILNDMLGMLEQHYDRLDSTPIEEGRIHDHEFRRFLWSGIKKVQRTKVLGFAYLTKVGTDLWFFLSYDQTPEFQESLPLLEDVVLSFEVPSQK